MSISRKRQRPANDFSAFPAQRMSHVVFPRTTWNRTGIGWAILCVIFALGASVTFFLERHDKAPEKPVIAAQPVLPVAAQPEPYDITINASELEPPDKALAVAGQMPEITIQPLGDGRQHALPALLEISVENASDEMAVNENDAGQEAAEARHFARQGDIQHALRLQHRAVEREPDNLSYRLALAVLYDRAGKAGGAAMLYRQVVEASQEDGDDVPKSVNIEAIRERLNYLVSSRQATE